MKEIDGDKLIIYVVCILVLVTSVPFLSKLPRSRGKNIFFHGIYISVAATALFFLPEFIQDDIFSPGGIVVVGTLLPVYESIRAICTPGESDDRIWLQYWITSGMLSYTTEFIDEIREYFPQGGEHWYELEFFVTIWLMFPLTDGATLIYDVITEPYVTPYAQKIKSKVESWIAILLTVVNTTYLSFVWFLFMTFPEEQRRFAVVAVGTIYPMAASTIAITTKSNASDVTFWLTYWSCFSLLFLAMDYLENFVGGIPGFYSICLMTTVYLFLPMFDGANVVFRRVLVPLTGQYENMLLHDTYLVRKGMEQSIAKKYHDRVFQKAAEVFAPTKQE